MGLDSCQWARSLLESHLQPPLCFRCPKGDQESAANTQGSDKAPKLYNCASHV